MNILTRSLINKCRKESPWNFGNKVLYDLCRKYPDHCDMSVVIAKIWLIGRAYAAAIERRKNKGGSDGDFYLKNAAPAICNSRIDDWIKNASVYRRPSTSSISSILSAHFNVTKLFCQISGLEKRSLASKYLHFHKPNLFYIYDRRAVAAMRRIPNFVGGLEERDRPFDDEYRKFTSRCIGLRDHIKENFGDMLNPRQLDNLLLEIHSKNA
ncbi:MAG: hypothetical protein K9N23_16505 [Akkermansiaceae bacterium]|nr:hypothetical protein [Akkermansiaceae bacterium]